jgi:hypothetical protein
MEFDSLTGNRYTLIVGQTAVLVKVMRLLPQGLCLWTLPGEAYIIEEMAGKRSRRGLFFLAFLPIIVLGFVFYFRPPVLLVTDLVFDRLYGDLRGRKMQAETSLRLFRRVKTVQVAENAGSDVVIFAVESAAKKPYCVLFPYRYQGEAERYVREHPEVPATVLLGRFRNIGDETSFGISTDTEGDFYRIGRLAAVIARTRNMAPEGEPETPGRVLFFRDDMVSPEDWEAFKRGLKEEEHPWDPLDVWGSMDYTVPESVSCTVLTGLAEFFLEKNLDIPVILFSWADPALTPSRVKVVFDDSPWTQAAAAVKILAGEREPGNIPSRALVLSKRIPDQGLLRNIKEAIQGIGP